MTDLSGPGKESCNCRIGWLDMGQWQLLLLLFPPFPSIQGHNKKEWRRCHGERCQATGGTLSAEMEREAINSAFREVLPVNSSLFHRFHTLHFRTLNFKLRPWSLTSGQDNMESFLFLFWKPYLISSSRAFKNFPWSNKGIAALVWRG